MKTLLLSLLFSSFLFAKFQTVYIGTIDREYQDKLSQERIYTTLMQIQAQFKTQLGYDVFAYAQDGKPINIVYLKPSAKKSKITKYKQKIASLKEEMERLELQREKEQISLKQQQEEHKQQQEKLNEKYSQYNNRVNALNNYIKDISEKNKQGLKKVEYERVEVYISSEQGKIKEESDDLDITKQQSNENFSSLKQKTADYNQLVEKYNQLVKKCNRIIRDSEEITKNFIEVKGNTKSQVITTYTTTHKNGKKSVSKSQKTSMNKIEIYDFETLAKFKAVLAHELGHLVGVEHVGEKGALMNPLLQDEQVDTLLLTPWDIEGFNKAFQ